MSRTELTIQAQPNVRYGALLAENARTANQVRQFGFAPIVLKNAVLK